MSWLAVALGGALGALARHWVYNASLKLVSGTFPYATFTVNAAGSLLIGIAFVLIVEQARVGPEWRGFVTVGFLGAFTTFSTFSLDALSLLERGEPATAALYVAASVVVCIAAAWLGLTLARQLL